jgi:pilus assembly protein CpaB
MRLATIISLGASAVLGIGALFVARVWLPASMDRPMAPAAAAIAQQQQGVPVVVAAGTLSYGHRLTAQNLKVITMPASAAPEGAFPSIEQVLAQDEGAPVVIVAMSQREPILPSKISGPGARASIAAEIAEGMRAYTIRVTDVAGGGGHIFPGDRVDVVLTQDLVQNGLATETGKRPLTDVVLQNVRVLAVNLNHNPSSTDPTVPSTATLEVDIPAAQKLAVAQDLGVLSLALRGSGSAEMVATRSMAIRDVNPALAARAAAAAPKSAPPGSGGGGGGFGGNSVRVVHGEDVQSVQVPAERGGA